MIDHFLLYKILDFLMIKHNASEGFPGLLLHKTHQQTT